MEDQSKLASDLGDKLERLKLINEKPEFFIEEHFTWIRNEIDLDAERLIEDYRKENSTVSSRKIVETNTIREKFLEFLDKMKTRLYERLQEAVNIAAFEGINNLEKRVEEFSSSIEFKDSNEMEETYLKLALDIIDATNELEKRLVDNQTIAYLPSDQILTMGKLLYLSEVFLNRYELSCFKSPSNRIRLIHETIQASLNASLVVGCSRPLALTCKILTVFEIAVGLFRSSETSAGVVVYLEGYSKPNFKLSFDDTQFYEELRTNWKDKNEIHACYESLDFALLTDAPFYFSDTKHISCNLGKNRLRRFDIASKLIGSIEFLDLSQNQLEEIDVEKLAKAAKLRYLGLVNSCLPSTSFSLGFLASLPDLVELRLTLPNASIDFEVFQSLANMQVFEVHSATSLDSSINRFQLTREHFKLLSTVMTKLSSLHLSHFKIESLQKDMVNGFVKLRDLALINNDIVHIEAGAFEKHPSNESVSFTTVDLSNNMIRLVNAQMFQGLEKCTDFDLSHNRIEELPSGLFDKLENLKELYLSNNLIRQITRGVFNKLPKLGNLVLNNNLIRSIEPGSFEDSPRIVKLSLANNKINSIVCQQIDQSKAMEKHDFKMNSVFGTLSSLKSLLLQGNQLEKLDLNCFADLTELLRLDLSKNQINELNKTIQAGVLSKLIKLDLSKNRLTRISRYAFSQSTKLRTLTLSGNRLEKLDEEFFHSFRRLAHIELDDSELVNNRSFYARINKLSLVGCSIESCEFFKLDDRFSSLRVFSSLTELDLRRNRIESINFKHLTTMPDLSILNLAENLIETIDDPSLFKNLKKLENLNLSGNKLKYVDRQLFKGLNKLQSLDLSNNPCLLNLDCGMFCGLFSLEKLYLTGNNIAFFNLVSLFQSCRLLECLDLSNNMIEILDDVTLFHDAQNLRSLNLKGNKLKHIHPQLFKCLSKLEALDLSNNPNILNLNAGLFRGLFSLKSLLLVGNKIVFFDLATLLRACRVLEFLNLSDNQLDNESVNETLVSGITAQNLKELMLANNSLEKMDFVQHLYRLEKLDLSGNKLESVILPHSVNPLSRLVQLKQVNLSNNQIKSLDIKAIFSHLKYQLELLDLSNNSFNSNQFAQSSTNCRDYIEQS